jgi:hypothetical protein
MEGKCYYCGEQKKFSSEHVIPNFLGCNHRVPTYMCTECNNSFGKGFESEYAKIVNLIRVLFNLLDSEGKPPPAERNIECEDGKHYDLLPGGIPVLHKPVYEKSSANNNEIIHAEYRNWEEAIGHLKNQLKKTDKIDLTYNKDFIGTLKFPNVQLDGSNAYRTVAKSVLNLIARCKDDLLIYDEIKELANYVKTGSGFAENWFLVDFDNDHVLPSNFGMLDNFLLINHNGSEPYIRGYFQLLGTFPFLCEIPFSSHIVEGFSFSLHHDPLTRKTDIQAHNPFVMNFLAVSRERWAKHDHFALMEKRISKTLGFYYQLDKEKNIHQIVIDSWDEVLGDPDGKPITPENVKDLSWKVAEKFTHWAQRIRKERKIEIRDIDEIPEKPTF